VYYKIKEGNIECNPSYTESDKWSNSLTHGGSLMRGVSRRELAKFESAEDNAVVTAPTFFSVELQLYLSVFSLCIGSCLFCLSA
jgi:hypothetical protein